MTDVRDTVAHLEASADRTPAAIRAWLLAKCADALGVPVETLDPSEPLESYGLGSVQLVSLAGDFEEWLGRRVPATLFWDYPTLDALVAELGQPSDDLA